MQRLGALAGLRAAPGRRPRPRRAGAAGRGGRAGPAPGRRAGRAPSRRCGSAPCRRRRRAPGLPDSRIRTVRSSSSPSTRVSPARCSKRLRFSVPEASITAPGSTAVTRPIGTKIRRRATTSTTTPSTRGGAVPTRRATTTSRTLPTRSPLGSKTVSPASRETYALLTVVTVPEVTVGAVALPGNSRVRDRRRVRPAGLRGQSAGRRVRRRRPDHRAVPGAGERVPPVGDVVPVRAHRARRRLQGADLHAVRRAALRRAPERRRRAHAGPHRPAARAGRCARSAASASWTWSWTTTARP